MCSHDEICFHFLFSLFQNILAYIEILAFVKHTCVLKHFCIYILPFFIYMNIQMISEYFWKRKYNHSLVHAQICNAFHTYHRQASVFSPPMFMEHDPHIPSLQDLLKVKVGSTVSLILINASSTIGPQLEGERSNYHSYVTNELSHSLSFV